MRKNCIGVALAATAISLCLFGCTTPPPSGSATQNMGWLATVIDRPTSDPGHICVDSALNTGFAIIAFQLGHESNQQIAGEFLKNAQGKSPDIARIRQADAADWRRSPSSSAVGGSHLVRCLADYHVVLTNVPVLTSCLHATEPMAALQVSRSTGRSESQAVSDTKALYGDFAPGAANTAALASHVYSIPTDGEILQQREKVFAQCIAAAPGTGGVPS